MNRPRAEPGGGPAPHHRVAIVGAGFSGLGLAIGLIRRGTTDVVLFERAEDVGGTWRDNTYPGAACDVPSALYSFSFAPNPSWSRSFSPQREIQEYLRDCARRFGVLPHIRFGHEVTGAAWNEPARQWEIETSRGRFRASVLVSARGPLSEPRLPDVPGLDTFDGPVFHSARWDHTHRLARQRVAVIGTGASAVQFVPEIQPDVAKLSVFQRTPPWILPRRDRRVTRAERALFHAVPNAQLLQRAAIYWAREAFVLGFVGDARRRHARSRIARVAARKLLESQVSDPALRAKLMPHFELGCKRVLLSNEYYPALTKENVEVVTEPIVSVRPHSIVTRDGAERPVDTIVLGTGFDVTGHGAAARTVGRNGTTLADAWAPRLAAYKGMTVPGFPNMFLMVGPNSGLGHSSIVFVIESQIAYVLSALDVMADRGIAAVDVTTAALRRWTEEIETRSAETVWTGGSCSSYYIDGAGHNVALWPGTSWSYRQRTRKFDLDAYEVHDRRHPMAAARNGHGTTEVSPAGVPLGVGAAAPAGVGSAPAR
jgi:cation diffusion facilitator CzcD-associated flavoprotein CzcO